MQSDILGWIVAAWFVASFVVMVLFHISKLTTRLTECEARLNALVPPDGYHMLSARDMTYEEKHGPRYTGDTA